MQSTTNDRATQSQINGAKSNGPTTDEGRAKCVNSSMKHGMFSSRVVLDNEDPAIYQSLLEAFLKIWNPTDAFEHECVVAIVNARWKFRRLEAIETAEMNLTMAEKRPEWDNTFDQRDAATEHALALRTSGNHLSMLSRYQEQQLKAAERNSNMLRKHRKKSGRAIPTRDEMSQSELEALNQKRNEPKSKEGPENTPMSLFKKLISLFLALTILLVTGIQYATNNSPLTTQTKNSRAKAKP